MKSVGKQLEAARLGRNWTPEAAAKITKIRIEQLLDLERDDFTRFPSPAYARGFVRLYAKSLGLDDRRMLAQLDGRLDSEEDSDYVPAPPVEYIPQRTEITAPIRISRFGANIIFILAGLFLGVFLLLSFISKKAGVPLTPPKTEQSAPSKKQETTPRAPSSNEEDNLPKPAVSKPPVEKDTDDVPKAKPAAPADLAKADAAIPVAQPTQPIPPPGAKHQLSLLAKGASWVRVIAVEKDGEKTLFEGMLEAGKKLEAEPGKPFEATQFNLKIAVPSAVEIILDGYNSGPNSYNSTPETFNVP